MNIHCRKGENCNCSFNVYIEVSGLPFSYAQSFDIPIQYVIQKNHVCISKIKVGLPDYPKVCHRLVRPLSIYSINGFHIIWLAQLLYINIISSYYPDKPKLGELKEGNRAPYG